MSKLMTDIVNPMLQTIVVTLVGLAVAQVNAFLKSKKIAQQDVINKQQEDWISEKVMEAIKYAEEQARKAARDPSKDNKASELKVQDAKDFLVNAVNKNIAIRTTMDSETMEQKIHAAMPEFRKKFQ